MGLANKVIKRLEQQADTIAQYRQLDDRRRSRIAELERKLGDAEREQYKLAAEVETRRKELDTLTHLSQAEFENVRKDRDHWKQARQDAHEAGELLLKCTQTLQAEIDTLRKQLADAQREASDEFTERQVLTAEQQEGEAAWQQQLDDAQAEIEKLRQQLDAARTEAVTLRTRNDALLEKYKRLRKDHARLGHLVEERGQELERLLAFVAKARETISPTMTYCDVEFLSSALAELDAGTAEPAPVAEPIDPDTRDQELERLWSVVDGDLLAEGILNVCREIGEARKHGAESGPSPVAEPLDAEDEA